jgi:hypothetical protein
MLVHFKNRASIVVLIVFILLTKGVDLKAQKVTFSKGYYVDMKGEKVKGYFNLDFIRQNLVKISNSEDIVTGKNLDIKDVFKIVIKNENQDSAFFLTHNIEFNGVNEKVYLEYLLIGDVNLLRAFSKQEKEIFFISSKKVPEIRRINKSDPKTFFLIYFKDCKDANWKIKDVYYEKSSLELAISQISDCIGKSRKVDIKDGRVRIKRPLSIGMKTSVGTLKPKLENEYFGSTFKPHSRSAGFGFNLQWSVTNFLTLSTEFNTSWNTIKSTDSIGRWMEGRWYSQYLFRAKPLITFQKREIIPIEIKYYWHRKNEKFIPVFSIGLIYNKLIAPKFDGDFNANYSDYKLSPDYPPHFGLSDKPVAPHTAEVYGKVGFGYFGTAAIQKPLNKSLSFALGFKYTYSRETLFFKDNTGYETNFLNKVNRFDVFAHLLYTFGQ